jgi:hypothetical protein
MAEALHSAQTETEGIHVIANWEHANASARQGETVAAGDVGKVSYQTDDDSVWLATGTGPNWVRIGGGNRKLYLKAGQGWPSTTNGCAGPTKTEWTTNDVDLQVLAFDQASSEYAQWTDLLEYWDGGTITATFLWTVTGGGAAESIRLGLQARAYANDDAIDQAWGTIQEVDDTWIANDDVHITAATSAITVAGNPGPDTLVQFRVRCDAANSDLSSDGLLLAVIVEYGQTD